MNFDVRMHFAQVFADWVLSELASFHKISAFSHVASKAFSFMISTRHLLGNRVSFHLLET